jgi:hypothetical protein
VAFCALGSLLAQIFSLPSLLGTAASWKFLLFLEVPLPILLLFGSLCFSESPKYLHIMKNDRKASSASIQHYYGKNHQLDSVLKDFTAEASVGNSEKSTSFAEILKTPYLRRALFVSVVANVVCMTNGAVLRTLFSATLLRRMSVENSMIEILVLFIAVLL